MVFKSFKFALTTKAMTFKSLLGQLGTEAIPWEVSNRVDISVSTLRV